MLPVDWVIVALGCAVSLPIRKWLEYSRAATAVPALAAIAAAARLMLWGVHDIGALASEATLAVAATQLVSGLAGVRSRRSAAHLQTSRYSLLKLSSVIARTVALLMIGFACLVGAFTSQIDLSRKTWPDAFAQMHHYMRPRYPFTDWKQINWEQLRAQAEPRIRKAAKEGDRGAYVRAIRQWAWSLRDGHVRLDGPDSEYRFEDVGGGLGLTLLRLDDDTIIANRVIRGGPASRSGMPWGARIVRWNGSKIDEALRSTPTFWSEVPQPTMEGIAIQQLRFLPRGPVGSLVSIEYSGETNQVIDVMLKRVVETDDTLALTDPNPERIGAWGKSVDGRVVAPEIGYLRIRGERISLGQLRPVAAASDILKRFRAAGVRKIIVDLRGNLGGHDHLAAALAGFFLDRPTFYEAASHYDPKLGRFAIHGRLSISPREPHFSGPLDVLVDKGCISSGEGLAMALALLSRSSIVGYEGTNGSFGIGDTTIRLPEGFELSFVPSRSLDARGAIQIDADATGQGGIRPGIRPQMTLHTARRQWLEHRDTLLEFAIDHLRHESR